MLKHKSFAFIILIIIAMTAQACLPNVATAQALENFTTAAPPNPLTLTITADPVIYEKVGQQIMFTYIIKNSGNTNLESPQFTVKDDLNGIINCGAAYTNLAPNTTVTCHATYLITQGGLNIVSITDTAIALDGSAGQSQPAASVTITKSTLSTEPLKLTISASPKEYDHVGQIIELWFTIKNNGNASLGPDQVKVNYEGGDSKLCGGDVKTILNPGETMWVCSFTITVTQNFLDQPTLPWGSFYASVGDAKSLPVSLTLNRAPTVSQPPLSVIQAEPLPDNSFTAEYAGITNRCDQNWWARIKITNHSASPFKSVYMTIKDTVNGTVRKQSDTYFFNYAPDVCVVEKGDVKDITIKPLESNASFMADSPPFEYDITGRALEATIKLCTDTDLKGQCAEKTIPFQAVAVPATVDSTQPDSAYVKLKAGTNCRKGAGTEFELVTAFGEGSRLSVIGQNETGNYLLVKSLYNPDISCWIVSGTNIAEFNLKNAPVVSVPPTPTADAPAFEASYAGVVCSNQVEIKLKNVSTTTFKSITISVNDTVADVVLSFSSNEFSNTDGCLPLTTVSKLDPGDSFTVSSPIFPADPTGHKLIATLRLCIEDDQGGQCSEEKIEFTP